MPTLDWIGKKAVVNHHREVPFHILKENESLSFGKKQSGNLIVEGDNLVTLKALLPYYKGKVKCIYIDPPYNTGNEGWVYNDNVNSPEIKKWLGQVVGKEMEDLSRHDKWLCMMYPRLSLLKEFLTVDGFIFISIGDIEYANLKLISDEIFDSQNFVGNIARITKKGGNKGDFLKPKKDYVLCYAREISSVKKHTFGKIINESVYKWETEIFNGKTRYFLKGEIPFRAKLDVRKNQRYFIECPDGSLIIPPGNVMPKEKIDGAQVFPESQQDKCWTWGIERYKKEKAIGRFYFSISKKSPFIDENGNKSKWTIRKKIFKDEVVDENGSIQKKEILQDFIEEFPNSIGTQELEDLGLEFNYAKPSALIAHLLSIASFKDSLVLDSFAGSGTTAQAVLELNKEDKGNRKFILCEMLPQVAESITRERAKRVIERDGLQEQTGFKFAKLGEPMYTADGDINPNIKYADLARHVFFMATGTPLAYNNTEFKTPLIGVSNGVAIYLLYNGILGDNSVNGGNRLTQKVLKNLPKHDGVKIIYGTACGLSEMMLRKNNIVFRQIPYSIFDK